MSNFYQLIDSGDLEKLEKIGPYIVKRPETQAIWPKATGSEKLWNKIDLEFQKDGDKGQWIKYKKDVPEKWEVEFDNIKFYTRLTPFGHVSFFPDQYHNWNWIKEFSKKSKRKLRILNLFGYTGLTSLVCASLDHEVTHIDASYPSIGHGRENQELSGLNDKKIRWINEDCVKFVEREIKRGNKYDAIIMDPPVFGRGPNGETWRFEDSFPKLVELTKQILSEKPAFYIITAYKIAFSPISLANVLKGTLGDTGTYESGELTLKDNYEKQLPMSIYTRWGDN